MNNSWEKKLGVVCVMSIVSISFAFTQQSKELSFFIQKALQNSPLLNDYRKQQEQGRIDSLRTRAGWGPQVSLNSTNYYAPVLKGWGYDQAITNGANLNTGVSISKEIVGRQNQRNQLEATTLQNRSLRNTGKISEQELKKSVTSQFLVAFGDWQQYLFNDEMLSLLKKVRNVTAGVAAFFGPVMCIWFAVIAIGLVTSLLNDESWKARRTSGFGAPPISR